MHIAGYLASLFIGISLGVIGGGGSILTVPVLVYLFGIDALVATTYSLFVVGTTSVVGSITYFIKGLVHLKIALLFGIPSIAAILVTKRYFVPAIPNRILSFGDFTLTKNIFLMLLFALIMIFASFSMIKQNKNDEKFSTKESSFNWFIILQGIGVGTITGFIGAGGGFLIIPALVNILKLPMKTAVGTSLFIIAINALFGFFITMNTEHIDCAFILPITIIAVVGIIIGSYLSKKINGKKLKPIFGWFVLTMGIYIILKETFLK